MDPFKIHSHDDMAVQSQRCSACRDTTPLPVEIDFAFQPIVDLSTRAVFACEALVRGANGESAHTVLSQNARTLDDIVREMLRPMLKTWLDDNLPGMVERIVRAEIERVSRGRP